MAEECRAIRWGRSMLLVGCLRPRSRVARANAAASIDLYIVLAHARPVAPSVELSPSLRLRRGCPETAAETETDTETDTETETETETDVVPDRHSVHDVKRQSSPNGDQRLPQRGALDWLRRRPQTISPKSKSLFIRPNRTRQYIAYIPPLLRIRPRYTVLLQYNHTDPHCITRPRPS